MKTATITKNMKGYLVTYSDKTQVCPWNHNMRLIRSTYRTKKAALIGSAKLGYLPKVA